MRTFIKKNDYFEFNDIRYTISELLKEFARSSNIQIIDNQTGFDITKEVFMNIAFKDSSEAYEYLYYFMDNFDLVELALTGGASSAIWRKIRGIE